MIACPTCGATGNRPCVRGRKYSAVWKKQIAFPEGHDSRRSAEKKAKDEADMDWMMSLADAIGQRIEAGNLPPQDGYGRYLFV